MIIDHRLNLILNLHIRYSDNYFIHVANNLLSSISLNVKVKIMNRTIYTLQCLKKVCKHRSRNIFSSNPLVITTLAYLRMREFYAGMHTKINTDKRRRRKYFQVPSLRLLSEVSRCRKGKLSRAALQWLGPPTSP